MSGSQCEELAEVCKQSWWSRRLVWGHWLAEEGSESPRFLLPLLREGSRAHMALGGGRRGRRPSVPFMPTDSEVEACSQEGRGGGRSWGREVGLLRGGCRQPGHTGLASARA